jgi:hypothetical protein
MILPSDTSKQHIRMQIISNSSIFTLKTSSHPKYSVELRPFLSYMSTELHVPFRCPRIQLYVYNYYFTCYFKCTHLDNLIEFASVMTVEVAAKFVCRYMCFFSNRTKRIHTNIFKVTSFGMCIACQTNAIQFYFLHFVFILIYFIPQ